MDHLIWKFLSLSMNVLRVWETHREGKGRVEKQTDMQTKMSYRLLFHRYFRYVFTMNLGWLAIK